MSPWGTLCALRSPRQLTPFQASVFGGTVSVLGQRASLGPHSCHQLAV